MRFEVTTTPTVNVPLNAQAQEWVLTRVYQGSVVTVDANGASTDLDISISGQVHSSPFESYAAMSSLTFYCSHLPSDAPTSNGTVDGLGVTLVFGEPSETDPDKLYELEIHVPIDVPVTLYPPTNPTNAFGDPIVGHLKSATLTSWWVGSSGYPV